MVDVILVSVKEVSKNLLSAIFKSLQQQKRLCFNKILLRFRRNPQKDRLQSTGLYAEKDIQWEMVICNQIYQLTNLPNLHGALECVEKEDKKGLKEPFQTLVPGTKHFEDFWTKHSNKNFV